MAYSVVQRTHEIGIRMALGADRGNIVRLVVRQALILAAIGVIVGSCLALAASRGLATLSVLGPAMGGGAKLLQTSAIDPLIYLGATAFLCAVAALAAYLPARRAATVDPMAALRLD
jgi:putative ABC transport system permease protein